MLTRLSQNDFFEILMKHTDGLVAFLEVVWDGDTIVDYLVCDLSDNYKGLLTNEADDFTGKSVRLIYPEFFDNGMFEIFNSCMTKDDFKISFERKAHFPESKPWLDHKVTRYKSGILLHSRDITRLKLAEKKLKSIIKEADYKNAILNDSEVISETASFRWYIKENKWFFSRNMLKTFERFIIKEGAYTKDGIFTLMNAEAKEKLNTGLENFTYYNKLDPINFKIVDDIYGNAYYLLSGSFYPSATGPVLLGVLRNITTTVKHERLLNQRNAQLQKSNDDLASFSHIVSHDLQEPLRKIQMFISRIDPENSYEKNESFLNRIAATSNRMQHLIKSILHFASLDFSEQIFKKIDLNDVLEESLNNLDEQISLKKAQIELKRLPEVLGVHDLLAQVFNNLISNALKYSMDDASCKISVYEEGFDVDVLYTNDAINLNGEDFHKIIVQDNGVGFKQENAHKVFKIFGRLHDKSKFSGTGIGLAICDKVLKMHKGFIDAHSEENVGTSFILYFPKKK